MGVDSASLGGEFAAVPDGPYLTNFQTPVTVAAPGVLTNDFGGTNLVADLVQTENGTVDLVRQASFVFTPAIGHCGPASFSYRVFDGTSYSAPSTVVFMVNCKPNADPDQVIVLEDSGTTAISVTSNDEDPDSQAFTVTAVTQGANGTVLINPGGTFVTLSAGAELLRPRQLHLHDHRQPRRLRGWHGDRGGHAGERRAELHQGRQPDGARRRGRAVARLGHGALALARRTRPASR